MSFAQEVPCGWLGDVNCAPEQLRPASSREELVEALAEDKQVPWTYTRVAEQIGGNQFEDISDERPSSSEWSRAQDATEEDQPARFRIRTKRPGVSPGPGDMEDTGSAPSQPAQRQWKFLCRNPSVGCRKWPEA